MSQARPWKLNYDGEDRLEVARATWRIVSRFVPGTLPNDHDRTTDPEVIERAVADLAERSFGNTIQWQGKGDAIVFEVLDSACLADDFVRMQHGDQANAFEPYGARAHCCKRCGAPRE